MALIAICFAVKYPLNPTQVSLVTMFTIGVPSFLLAQIPNEGLIKGNFMRNVIFTAAPAALTNVLLIAAASFIGGVILQLDHMLLSTTCAFIWAVVGFVYMVRLCQPLDKIKTCIIVSCITGMIFCVLFLKDLFGLEHDISWQAWSLFGGIVIFAPIFIVIGEKLFKWINDVLFEKYVQKFISKLPEVSDKVSKKKAKIQRNRLN